jgi:hypothetical protein
MCTGALEEARSPESHSSCGPFAVHVNSFWNCRTYSQDFTILRLFFFFFFLPEFELGSEGTQVLFWGPVGSGRLMIWKISVFLLFLGDLIFDP